MPTTPAGQRLRLYDTDDLNGVMQTMARHAATLLPASQAALIGIQRRGQPEMPLYPLKVKRYADDLSVLHSHTELIEYPLLGTLDLANTTLLIVDDVLFEGHSLLRTFAYLAQLAVRRVYTAVLVDRHVCQQPVHPHIVGVHLQVGANDIVECNVPPYEAEFCIEVLRHGAAR